MTRKSLIAKLLDDLDEVLGRLKNLEEDILHGLYEEEE